MKSTWACCSAVLLACVLLPRLAAGYEVVYAVNCGGGRHTDRFGVEYAADNSNVGVPSDFGRSLMITRVHPEDMVLYQTERYHTSTFMYEIPIDVDGDYFLVTKFAEVYFTHPGQKVFDVLINGATVIADLDIFLKVGKAAGHDEITPFKVADGRLSIGGENVPFDGSITVEFAKGPADNPKVNAIVLLRGPLDMSELPFLPPPEKPAVETETPEEDTEWGKPVGSQEKESRRTSGPKAVDPYSSDDSWFMPITIAIAVFLPVLFCLCRVR